MKPAGIWLRSSCTFQSRDYDTHSCKPNQELPLCLTPQSGCWEA